MENYFSNKQCLLKQKQLKNKNIKKNYHFLSGNLKKHPSFKFPSELQKKKTSQN